MKYNPKHVLLSQDPTLDTSCGVLQDTSGVQNCPRCKTAVCLTFGVLADELVRHHWIWWWAALPPLPAALLRGDFAARRRI